MPTDWNLGKNRKFLCVLCGRMHSGYGHNPEPLVEYELGRACDDCNQNKVLPARFERIRQGRSPYG